GTAARSSRARLSTPPHHAQPSTARAPPITPPYQTRPEPETTLLARSCLTELQFSIRKSTREPTSPPTSAARIISHAHSGSLPSSRIRLATIAPATTNAQPNAIPKV